MSDSNRVLRILHSPQILNGLLLSKDFEQGEITNSLHPQKREVCQNDPGNEFEGDIFAQTASIPQWRALDQTLLMQLPVITIWHSEQFSVKITDFYVEGVCKNLVQVELCPITWHIRPFTTRILGNNSMKR